MGIRKRNAADVLHRIGTSMIPMQLSGLRLLRYPKVNSCIMAHQYFHEVRNGHTYRTQPRLR